MRNLNELEIEDSVGPPPVEEVRALEQHFGVTLPLEYRALLQVANGGDVGVPCFDFDLPGGRSGTGSISSLFQITDDREDEYSVWDNTTLLRETLADADLENSVIAVAETGGGDMIYLDFAEKPPSVRILYRTSGNSRPMIASTFEEFLNKLYLAPDPQQS